MDSLKQDIKSHLAAHSHAYFNLKTPPFRVELIKSVDFRYSGYLIFEVEFNVAETLVRKRLFVKRDTRTDLNRYGGAKKYLDFTQELKTGLDRDRPPLVSIPRVYDVTQPLSLIISEYIAGENCEKAIFKLGAIFKMHRRTDILNNAVDIPFLLQRRYSAAIDMPSPVPTMRTFVDNLLDRMAKGPFTHLSKNLKDKIPLYLESCANKAAEDLPPGLICGDYQLKNIICGDDGVFYLVDFEPCLGSACLNIAHLVTQIRWCAFSYPVIGVWGLAGSYVATVLERIQSKYRDIISPDVMRFYLIKSTLDHIEYCFRKNKVSWLISKLILEKDLSDLLNWEYCNLKIRRA